jgi:3-oxoacyl-(acyl-carrier-protein) synthase
VNSRRVVITGLGPVTPLGIGVSAFWSALLEGRCGIQRIASFDPARFDSQIGGEIANLAVGDYVPKSYRKAAKIMARDIMLAVAAAPPAVSAARLTTKCLIARRDAGPAERGQRPFRREHRRRPDLRGPAGAGRSPPRRQPGRPVQLRPLGQ